MNHGIGLMRVEQATDFGRVFKIGIFARDRDDVIGAVAGGEDGHQVAAQKSTGSGDDDA